MNARDKLPYLVNQMLEDKLDVVQIIGGAGVGKTTLTKTLITVLKEKDIKFHLMGTTGVAARITSMKTEEAAMTIHQKIFRYSSELSSEGETVFEITNNESDESQIVIVDEASMVGNKNNCESNLIYGSGRLLSDLIESYHVRQGSKTKLFFVGDKYQLAPVFEEFSPALSKSYLEEMFQLRVEELRLTENYRQVKSPEILEFAKQFLTRDSK